MLCLWCLPWSWRMDRVWMSGSPGKQWAIMWNNKMQGGSWASTGILETKTNGVGQVLWREVRGNQVWKASSSTHWSLGTGGGNGSFWFQPTGGTVWNATGGYLEARATLLNQGIQDPTRVNELEWRERADVREKWAWGETRSRIQASTFIWVCLLDFFFFNLRREVSEMAGQWKLLIKRAIADKLRKK